MEGMPPGLTRRCTPPDDYEAIYPCAIDPTEALVVEAAPGGDRRVSFSMLLGHQGADEIGCIGWETECACLDRESVRGLVSQLQAWLGDDEIVALRRWKAEATEVIEAWDRVFEAAGQPGPLGGSKAEAVLALFTDGGPSGV